MPILRCTSKLLKEIDESPAVDSAPSSSPLGDWYGHLFTVERRKCIIFINEPTLFVCIAFNLLKADYRNIRPFFVKLLIRTLYTVDCANKHIEWILKVHEELPIGKTCNRSTLGSLNNRVADAKAFIQYHGGLEHCNLEIVANALNDTPMAPIGYSKGREQMERLVAKHAPNG